MDNQRLKAGDIAGALAVMALTTIPYFLIVVCAVVLIPAGEWRWDLSFFSLVCTVLTLPGALILVEKLAGGIAASPYLPTSSAKLRNGVELVLLFIGTVIITDFLARPLSVAVVASALYMALGYLISRLLRRVDATNASPEESAEA
ncbi:hypothetical protein [Corynebacterium tapiri]|uniref:Uncharacterized protein n=1 Tax=Corynebacterium tapiri TaxID=1448266 RepID=A0A5C4U3A5_9CORY|nr:hypothetical protein [Corynebacterium tapiri]TNL97397.1 hypothetical protein FHE74_06955 [Corynebacterium tapiri]